MSHTVSRKFCQLGWFLLLGIWQESLFAASTDLADTPLPVQSSIAPNIMFMLDNSGSMQNIAESAPYDNAVTYLNCSSPLPYGAATAVGARGNARYYLEVHKITGQAEIWNGSISSTNISFGPGNCFAPNQYYSTAGLLADQCNDPGDPNYCYSTQDSIYTGNYLNWYFGSPANYSVPDTMVGSSTSGTGWRKSGTQTRLEIVKNASKNVLDGLDKVRVGLFTYNVEDGGTLLKEMGDISATRPSMKSLIDGLSATSWTPLAETLSDVGRYFTTGTTASNLTLHPGGTSSSTASISSIFNSHTALNSTGATTLSAPITAWCQKSFVLMMTDGLPTKDQNISNSLKEYYGYCTANPSNCTGSDGKRKKTLDTSGNPTTIDEFYESSDSSDYLDDVANALYDIDLRPDLVPTSPAVKTTKNNVTTYTIGFADPMLDSTTLLERAAKYGGGLSLTASNATSLVQAFQTAADDILSKDGSAAAVAVANAHVTNTDNASYATSYNSGVWSGDLIAYPINTTTGIPDINAPIWNTGCASPTAYVDPLDTAKGILGCSAQVLLDLKTSATRKIFTNNDTSTCFSNCGIPFQPTTASGALGVDKLSTAQQTLLNTPTQTDGAAVVAYLRGDKSGETAGTYRVRSHLLGDTVNAEPLVIREPSFNYSDADYSTFKSTNSNRARIVLQPANDGMVHAFNSLTGVEEWAYIPNLLISNAKDPANASTSLLNTRTRKSFNHYYLVDGTPVMGDVDLNNAGSTGNTSTNWATIAVGGLARGGRGYYALNVTSTTATDEATATSKALWEFPRSVTNTAQRNSAIANMGYSYGKPIIVKTTAAGWVVLVTSGYNNGTNPGDSGGDGLGHLYVLNASTGDLIADLTTAGCHATPQSNPCGLASVSAYVENTDTNNLVELAYGGDLYGNLYRFDFRGATIGSWTVSKMATLRSGNTTGAALQSITSAPELAKVTVSAGVEKYFVYVGTGVYLGKTDLPCPPTGSCGWTPNSQSTQTQTMYGLTDDRTTTALADPLLPNLVAQTITTSGSTRTISTNTVNFSTKKGWYVNFTGGERMVTDPAIASGGLVFTSNIPSTTQCVPGGSSWLNVLNYQTGGQVAGASFGGVYLGTALASRPVLIQLPSGVVKAIVRLSDTTTVTTSIPVTATSVVPKRTSWRELFDK